MATAGCDGRVKFAEFSHYLGGAENVHFMTAWSPYSVELAIAIEAGLASHRYIPRR